MSTGNKRHLGMGNAPGSPMKTNLGNSMKGAQHATEVFATTKESTFYGWLRDIRMPIGDSNVSQDQLPGVWVKITFDSSPLRKRYGNQWFRLKHDPGTLIQEFGTEESIRGFRLRLALTIKGTNILRGEATIVADGTQEYVYRGLDLTPIRAWADLFSGLRGGLPTS